LTLGFAGGGSICGSAAGGKGVALASILASIAAFFPALKFMGGQNLWPSTLFAAGRRRPDNAPVRLLWQRRQEPQRRLVSAPLAGYRTAKFSKELKQEPERPARRRDLKIRP